MNKDKKTNVEIVGFIDNDNSKWGNSIYKKPIYQPEEISVIDYEYIVITSAYYANDIYNQLIDRLHISKDKIISLGIFYNKRKYIENFNKIEMLLNYTFSDYIECSIEPHQIAVISRMIYDKAETSFLQEESSIYHQDYVRYRTFELCADEIINASLPGNIAEVGVFRGGFARIINKKLSFKNFYLFDTFESFSKTDFEKDAAAYEQIAFDADYFKTTDINKVLGNMYHPSMCIIKKAISPRPQKD